MTLEGWIGVMDGVILFLMPLLAQFPTLIRLFSFSFLVFSNRVHRASSNISALLHSPLNYLWSSGKYEELPPPSGSVSDTCVSCVLEDREPEGWWLALQGRVLETGPRISVQNFRWLSLIANWSFSRTRKPGWKYNSSLYLLTMQYLPQIVCTTATQPEQKVK